MSYPRRTQLLALVAVAVVTATGYAVEAGGIYWSDPTQDDGGIWAANLDGSHPRRLRTGQTSGITIDPVARKFYWGQYNEEFGTTSLRRANLDGSHMEILFDPAAAEPTAMALDREAGWIYYSANFFEGCIGILRQRMSGAGDFDWVIDGCAFGIAVDPAAGKLYWAQGYPDHAIKRSNLDGSAIEILLVPPGIPGALALDASRGQVYWTQGSGEGIVLRADTDGSNLETVIPGEFFAHSLALDLRADKLYWGIDYPVREINRAGLDGSISETILEVPSWGQIAIDPVPGEVGVPAVSVRGTVVLVLLMLLVSAVVLRRTGLTRRDGSG